MKISAISAVAVATLLICLTEVSTGVVGPETCPNYPVTQNFNRTLFQGKWFVIEDTAETEIKNSCVEYEFTDLGNGCLRFEYSGIDMMRNQQTLDAVVSPENTYSSEGKLTLANGDEPSELGLWILDTDYSDYAIVLLCGTRENEEFHALVVLSRHNFPGYLTGAHIHASLCKIGFDVSKLTPTVQYNCLI